MVLYDDIQTIHRIHKQTANGEYCNMSMKNLIIVIVPLNRHLSTSYQYSLFCYYCNIQLQIYYLHSD